MFNLGICLWIVKWVVYVVFKEKFFLYLGSIVVMVIFKYWFKNRLKENIFFLVILLMYVFRNIWVCFLVFLLDFLNFIVILNIVMFIILLYWGNICFFRLGWIFKRFSKVIFCICILVKFFFMFFRVGICFVRILYSRKYL